jgi:two-component system chemotaxis response regulator CheB
MTDRLIRVLVVDDSAVVRQVLSSILGADPAIAIVGSHADPIFAQRSMEREWPDVIVLDIEMPRMDGITFLKQIMSTRPTPVIICSKLTTEGSPASAEAMRAGAFGVLDKPVSGVKEHMQVHGQRLLALVKSAAQSGARPLCRRAVNKPHPVAVLTAEGDLADELLESGSEPSANVPAAAFEAPARATRQSLEGVDRIVAIGTSTGGTQALESVLSQLPANAPGIVVVQHMPQAYTQSFAQRLDSVCAIRVKEAEDGEQVQQGVALIAPGGKHLSVRRQGQHYHAVVKDGPPVSRHKPSVNVLFNSLAKHAGRNAVGIIMTGMGDDGARGLLDMNEAGCSTFAQDEGSCVVFGMPKEAIKLGGVDEVLPLGQLHEAVMGRKPPKGRKP